MHAQTGKCKFTHVLPSAGAAVLPPRYGRTDPLGQESAPGEVMATGSPEWVGAEGAGQAGETLNLSQRTALPDVRLLQRPRDRGHPVPHEENLECTVDS